MKWALLTYRALAEEESANIILGHPYDYATFKDTARVELFSEALDKNKVASLTQVEHFLRMMRKVSVRRPPLLYYIFSTHPKMLLKLTKRFFELCANSANNANNNNANGNNANSEDAGMQLLLPQNNKDKNYAVSGAEMQCKLQSLFKSTDAQIEYILQHILKFTLIYYQFLKNQALNV